MSSLPSDSSEDSTPAPPAPPAEPIVPEKPIPTRPTDESAPFLDKPAFPTKPVVSHSPKISPSSIPNPSPSVSTTKVESYPNYGGYLYSIPGYSAFQPVFQNLNLKHPPQPAVIPPPDDNEEDDLETSSANVITIKVEPHNALNDHKMETDSNSLEIAKTDFEDNFTPQIVPVIETKCRPMQSPPNPPLEAKEVRVTKPIKEKKNEAKKTSIERNSTRASIPISNIDSKCVNNTIDTISTPVQKKPRRIIISPPKVIDTPRIEIHSNIVIKSAESREIEQKADPPPACHNPIPQSIPNANIAALLSAAEELNKADSPYWKHETKKEFHNEPQQTIPQFSPQKSANIRPPICVTTTQVPAETKINFTKPEVNYSDKKSILLIQNKKSNSQKMVLTISQSPQNQMVLQRANNINIETKTITPSRVSANSKADKDSANKVVALKRLHQDNGDENDFENLITENQIYGNKIVVKEKTHVTIKDQDIKPKKPKIGVEKGNQASEAKNLLSIYVSNVQFPGNLMMIKNNAKITQTQIIPDNKIINNKNISNENIIDTKLNTINVNDTTNIKSMKCQPVAINKEMNVLKSSNNVLQIKNKQNTDMMFPSSQKVLTSPQIVYQVIDGELQKLASPISANHQITQQSRVNIIKEHPSINLNEETKDKLFIACPYQVEVSTGPKTTPKIVITNLRPKASEEISSLDLYEKRRRIRRLKHLVNRDILREKDKEAHKNNVKRKEIEKVEKLIILPNTIETELAIEFSERNEPKNNEGSDDENDYGDNDMVEYKNIIREFDEDNHGLSNAEHRIRKAEFLSNFRLASPEVYKGKEIEKQERMLKFDSVATAYIAAGQFDRVKWLMTKSPGHPYRTSKRTLKSWNSNFYEDNDTVQKKMKFLKQLNLNSVSPLRREEFERVWETVVNDKRKRNGSNDIHNRMFNETTQKTIDTNLDTTKEQLQILTEINKCVNQNNNLIKKHLANTDTTDIHLLAEKNISELNRLSKLADSSVKLLSGKERNVNLNLVSQNIKQKHVEIVIPNAAKVNGMKDIEHTDVKDNCVAQPVEDEEPVMPWPGIETVLKSFKQFNSACKKEIEDLQERNKKLRAENGHATQVTVKNTEWARRRHIAERNAHLTEEQSIRASLTKMINIVNTIKNYKRPAKP